MAKKTTTPRTKSASKGAADLSATPAAAPAVKPRARSKTAKAIADEDNTIVVTETIEVTELVFEPTADDIRVRAYHRYLERGGSHGMDFEDWLEAERELRRRK